MSLTIKNYKDLEGFAHDSKDFRIGTIYETPILYSFSVAYNSIPYIIKIYRVGTIANEYEIVLRDGADMIQYGRQWIGKHYVKTKHTTTRTIESMIQTFRPKGQRVSGNTNFNNPF